MHLTKYDQPQSNQIINLISDPFSSELNSVSFFASMAWTLGLSSILAIGFCLLRPRTNAVYAPRAKHADAKHAPPHIDGGLFSWVHPIKNVKEVELLEKIGLDAVVFLRFLRMLRNIFIFLTIFGLIIILPVNLTGSMSATLPSTRKRADNMESYHKISKFIRFTPQFGSGSKFWAYTFCAYLFDAIICAFIAWNYRKVVKLKNFYFESEDYVANLNSRTLLITQIPTARRTDEGLLRLTEQALAIDDSPMTAISRNVKDLPELIEEHNRVILELEKTLAKYLKDPNHLPAKRPTCKPSKKDKARNSKQEVDAIDYLIGRIRELEQEVKETRRTIDQRNPMPYGFASYTRIEDAHAVAYAARKSGPEGCVVRLAPKPHDIIWTNLAMTRRERGVKSFWNGVWMTLLTIVYIVPNILTAVFLSDFSNLGKVWPYFEMSLSSHRNVWGIVQGIVAPLVQAIFYLILPVFGRRLLNGSDPTKTSRERHVISRLYSFYVFNQLIIFSIFAAIWQLIAGAIKHSNDPNTNVWEFVKSFHVFAQLVAGLCNTSPYFITAQLQKNLTAAVDLLQAWPLIKGTLMRKFGSPTPRETIELSAPQPFAYADYYNAYLYVSTVGLAFGTINPIILPITTFFISIDSWLKKYLLQYVFITKTESGGLYWRMVINRLIFAMLLSNLVMALVIGAQGLQQYSSAGTAEAAMLYALVPLPFLICGFKLWLSRTFDDQIAYRSTHPASSPINAEDPTTRRNDELKRRQHNRVAVRFGNPALYKKLLTPLVSAKSRHLLKELCAGRLDDHDRNDDSNNGYSDVYMTDMAHDKPGKAANGKPEVPFEIVHENDMNFETFKRREEFRERFGGGGELYGDGSRPGSRGSMSTTHTFGLNGLHGRHTSGSPGSSRPNSPMRYNADLTDNAGVIYPRGYHAAQRLQSDSPVRGRSLDITTYGHPAFRDASPADSVRALVGQGAPMGRIETQDSGAYNMHINRLDHYRSASRSRSPGTDGVDEETSYDYFRRGSRR